MIKPRLSRDNAAATPAKSVRRINRYRRVVVTTTFRTAIKAFRDITSSGKEGPVMIAWVQSVTPGRPDVELIAPVLQCDTERSVMA